MKTIEEAKEAVGNSLGVEAKEAFNMWIDELTFFVRRLAKEDLETSEEDVEKDLAVMCRNILIKAVQAFMKAKMMGDKDFSVKPVDNILYDHDLNEIPEIVSIQNQQAEITNLLLTYAMEEFRKGRGLFKQVARRSKRFVNKKRKRVRNNVYKRPLEAIEIDIMRYERRLADLTPKEAKELSYYYILLKNENNREE